MHKYVDDATRSLPLGCSEQILCLHGDAGLIPFGGLIDALGPSGGGQHKALALAANNGRLHVIQQVDQLAAHVGARVLAAGAAYGHGHVGKRHRRIMIASNLGPAQPVEHVLQRGGIAEIVLGREDPNPVRLIHLPGRTRSTDAGAGNSISSSINGTSE